MKYLIVVLVFFYFNSFSQIKFNKTDSCFYGPNMRNVIIQDDNYYSSGGCYNNNVMGIVFNKYDLLGNLIESKYLTGDTLEWADGRENSLRETNTGNYIVGGNRGLNYYRDNLLIKLDHNLDTIFTKTYHPVNDGGHSDVLIYNSNIDTDGNYLLVGTSNIDNNYNIMPEYQMQLIKTDTLGNLLWRKTYGNSTYKYYGYKVVPAYGGGYLLGGYSNKNGGDNCIIKVDENGENPIFKYFGDIINNDGRIIEITKTQDSCYVISASVEVTSTGYNKAHIYKLDSNLNIMWDKLYLNYGTVSFFCNALEKENGNLIVHGNEKNTQNRQQMVIMELTAGGDSIWKQTTTALDTTESQNYMESGKLTPDGGMVFAGWNTNINQTPFQQMWLVKTDSLGCDGTEFTCGGTTKIPTITSNTTSRALKLWPNPTKNTLFVELKGESKKLKVGNNSNQSNYLLKKRIRDTDIPLTKQEFQKLPINQKLKYSSKNPNNKLWGEAEKQEMRELQRKYAYMLPFEVINGKVDIFSIDPAFAMQVKNENFNTKNTSKRSRLAKNDKAIDISNKILTIYNIFGTEISKTNMQRDKATINVSNLQKGVYIIKLGEYSAKFVKE